MTAVEHSTLAATSASSRPASESPADGVLYGVCSRSLPPGLVQAMQQSLSRTEDWEKMASAEQPVK